MGSVEDSRNRIASGSPQQINEADPMVQFRIRDTTVPVLALSGSKEVKPVLGASWSGMAHSTVKIPAGEVNKL
jgi:hypothetical protein